MRTGYITPHFPWPELRCHDGTDVPPELEASARKLCALLEGLRTMWGGALVVVSGYRTPLYNVRIGGAPNSQHVLGAAADIRPLSTEDVPRLSNLVRTNVGHTALDTLGGWGSYPGWIHVDVRPRPASGHVAYWTGTGVGSEVA